MDDEPAATNVNRSYSLGATSIAIFTFILVFVLFVIRSFPRVQTARKPA